jgi:hypothetical protein
MRMKKEEIKMERKRKRERKERNKRRNSPNRIIASAHMI